MLDILDVMVLRLRGDDECSGSALQQFRIIDASNIQTKTLVWFLSMRMIMNDFTDDLTGEEAVEIRGQ